MNLYTKNKDTSWNRIVDIFVNLNDDLITSINEENTCKLILITEGNGTITIDSTSYLIIAPTLICINPNQRISINQNNNLLSTVIYFKPTIINDKLIHNDIISGKFNNVIGSTIYQDYLLLDPFYKISIKNNITKLSPSALISINNLIHKVEQELSLQFDFFWPCRSRSYLIELLFYINSYIMHNNSTTDNSIILIKDNLIKEIICYINEHINEKITLEILSKKFVTNRTKINKLFKDNLNLTFTEYLIKTRINLSSLLLTDTELPINEISERVGFLDVNYFIRTFKKHTSLTPFQYRKKNSIHEI